ncbi:hypothetical protein Pcinc_009306 [Petrolisthes cinctipes]|uniref:C-type lectin domain-containing protein n=1 Tax=Petrolisthes cinctipes TaxID=88211 RepID=A0AAE1G748_PETCI|nr:hypothetical protein Pcinc_009306 [Petrolisthes cinctipes]
MTRAHEMMTTTKTLVFTLCLVGGVAEGMSTFLLVTQNVAPPPSTANLGASTTSLAGCGLACFNAAPDNNNMTCLAFLWTPTPLGGERGNNNNVSDTTLFAPSVEGLCELLACLPHPASLQSSPRAQMYVLRGRTTPSYGPDAAPASYVMACTFAYRVYSKVKLTYSKAEDHCAEDGASLIIIKDAEQEKIVLDAVNQGEGYWMGLSDREVEGVWRWADGSSLGYSNWDRGQPNNYILRGSDQDCAMLYRGAWNDHHCLHPLRFVCQITFVQL